MTDENEASVLLPDETLNAAAEREQACVRLHEITEKISHLDTTSWDDELKVHLLTDLRIAVRLLKQWENRIDRT